MRSIFAGPNMTPKPHSLDPCLRGAPASSRRPPSLRGRASLCRPVPCEHSARRGRMGSVCLIIALRGRGGRELDFTFRTFAKGRWLGRALLEVLAGEFQVCRPHRCRQVSSVPLKLTERVFAGVVRVSGVLRRGHQERPHHWFVSKQRDNLHAHFYLFIIITRILIRQ